MGMTAGPEAEAGAGGGLGLDQGQGQDQGPGQGPNLDDPSRGQDPKVLEDLWRKKMQNNQSKLKKLKNPREEKMDMKRWKRKGKKVGRSPTHHLRKTTENRNLISKEQTFCYLLESPNCMLCVSS